MTLDAAGWSSGALSRVDRCPRRDQRQENLLVPGSLRCQDGGVFSIGVSSSTGGRDCLCPLTCEETRLKFSCLSSRLSP